MIEAQKNINFISDEEGNFVEINFIDVDKQETILHCEQFVGGTVQEAEDFVTYTLLSDLKNCYVKKLADFIAPTRPVPAPAEETPTDTTGEVVTEPSNDTII
jgi:hypothetical protein